MNEQDMREAIEHGQIAMSELIDRCDLDRSDPKVKLAEVISKEILDLVVARIEQHGLVNKHGSVNGDGAKVILLATHSAAIAAALVARVASEAMSAEHASELLEIAKKINRKS